MASTQQLIEQAVKRFQAEVPALAQLKLVFGLELRGRGDVQLYRVEVPGPSVKKGFAEEERVHVSLPRSDFNELATEGTVKHYREAFEAGHIKVSGDAGIQKLIATVIARQEERSRVRKVH